MAHQCPARRSEHHELTLSIWLEIVSSRSSRAAAEDRVKSTDAVDARGLYHFIVWECLFDRFQSRGDEDE